MTKQIPISFIAFGNIKDAIKDIPKTFTEAQKFQDILQLHDLNDSTPIVLRDDNNKLIPLTCTIKDFLENYNSENPIYISVGKFYVIYIPTSNNKFQKYRITLECSIPAIKEDLLSLFPKTFKEDDHIYLQPCDSIFLYDDTNEKIENKWQDESEEIEIQVHLNIDVVKFTFLNSFEDPKPTLFYINKANPTTFQDVYGDFYDQYEFEISILEEETKTVINDLSAQVDPNKSYLILPKRNFLNETKEPKDGKIIKKSSQTKSLTTSAKGKSSQSKDPSPPKSDPSTKKPRPKFSGVEKPPETNDQGIEYDFKLSNRTYYFSVSVLKTDKVRDVIQKILETHKDVERIALFVGSRGNEEQLDKDDIFSEKVPTNQIVLVKNLLRYIINYPDGSTKHRNYVQETTVGDVRGIFKQRHEQDCMLYDKNDKLLEDETLLKTLPDLTFTIKIPTPVYNFEITNTFTDQKFSKEVEIPDHTRVDDCRNILKNAIPELKDYHEIQITIDVDFQSIFGETIQPPGPISVTISDPSYTWYTCISTLRGVDKYGLDELTFPLDYTIQDVIDQFESENPCYSYVVLDETKKELDTSINLFEHQLFDQTCRIERRNKEFSLAMTNQPHIFITFIPKAEWPLGVTAQFLTYSNNSISFTSKKPITKAVIPKYPIPSCDWHNRLEFTHNGKTYSKDTTFQELKFEKGEEYDTSITVTLAPPTLHFSTLDNTYSLPTVDTFLSKSQTVTQNEEINSLTAQLSAKDKQIDVLNSSISSKDKEINQLKEYISVLKEKSLDMKLVENHEYEEGQILGKGATSVVQKVAMKKHQEYAKKELTQFDHKTLQRFLHEAEVLFKLRHPCIVRIFGFNYGDDQHPPSIFLSLEPNSLESSIRNHQINHNEKNRIIVEIVLGMRYIHFNNLIHRDLKPENILLSRNKHVRISDFGLAKEESFETSQSKGVGTLRFMAPELLREEAEYTNKVDVYSFGITLIFILMNEYPKFNLLDVATGKFPQLPSTTVEWVTGLIHQCLSVSPEDRPPFAEIFEILKSHNFDLFTSTENTTPSSQQQNFKQDIQHRILKIEAFEYQLQQKLTHNK